MAAPGPIALSVGDKGFHFDLADEGHYSPPNDSGDWLVERVDGPHRLLLDIPPQAGRDTFADRLIAALKKGHLHPLETARLRFAGVYHDGRQLLLFRDAIGNRPLHYRLDDRGIRIASMAQDLWEESDRANWNWLARRATMRERWSDATANRSVKRILPGHILRWSKEGGTQPQERWWKPRTDIVHRTPEEARIEAHRLIGEAARRAVAEAGPTIAAQLSGGLDSTLVVLEAQAAANPGQQVVAFSGAPSGSQLTRMKGYFLDDAERARDTAEQIGVAHHVVAAEDDSLVAIIERWNALLGEPLANVDNLSWLSPLAARAAKLGARRMLTGAYGNFTISWPGTGVLAELRRRGEWRRWASAMRRHRELTGASWLGVLAMSFPAAHRWWQRLRSAPQWRDRNLFVKGEDGAWRLPDDMRAVRNNILLGTDPGPWNEAVRRAHGLDEVDLFADRDVVEFSLTLSESVAAAGGETRWLARALLRERMPDGLVEEQRRGMQGADWASRFAASRQGLRDEIEKESDRPLFDLDAMANAIEEFDPRNAASCETSIRFDLVRSVAALHCGRMIER